MNRALLNPFEEHTLPESIEEYLEQDKATCMRFNRHGNLLVAGTSTGRLVLWDFDTKSVAQFLGDLPNDSRFYVTSVSFPAPRTGSTILASYSPGMVRLYDTLANLIVTEIQFDVPVVQVEAHPKDAKLAVAVPKDSLPMLLHLRRGTYIATISAGEQSPAPSVRNIMRFPATADGRNSAAATKDRPNGDSAARSPKRPPGVKSKIPEIPSSADYLYACLLCGEGEAIDNDTRENQSTRRKCGYVVRFTRKGDNVLRGGPLGIIRTFTLGMSTTGEETRNVTCVATVEVPGRANIKDIILTRKNDKVLVVSMDKCMRLFETTKVTTQPANVDTALEPMAVFTEVVNRLQCQCACFSRDGDFVLGGMVGTDHHIRIWRTGDGQLEKTLEGPKEGIGEILCHPQRPVIASLGGSYGGIYVWAKNFTENWSAFAPDFVELEANEEYVEREDEFDAKDSGDDAKKKEEQERAEQEVIVDVVTCDKTELSSDSAGDDGYFYVPATPAPDSTLTYSTFHDGPGFEESEKFRNRHAGDSTNGSAPSNGRVAPSRKRSRSSTKSSGQSRRTKHRARQRSKQTSREAPADTNQTGGADQTTPASGRPPRKEPSVDTESGAIGTHAEKEKAAKNAKGIQEQVAASENGDKVQATNGTNVATNDDANGAQKAEQGSS